MILLLMVKELFQYYTFCWIIFEYVFELTSLSYRVNFSNLILDYIYFLSRSLWLITRGLGLADTLHMQWALYSRSGCEVDDYDRTMYIIQRLLTSITDIQEALNINHGVIYHNFLVSLIETSPDLETESVFIPKKEQDIYLFILP